MDKMVRFTRIIVDDFLPDLDEELMHKMCKKIAEKMIKEECDRIARFLNCQEDFPNVFTQPNPEYFGK